MKQAVWIIAHGSSKKEWVEQVDNLIKQLVTPVPIITSFFDKVSDRLIEDGIKQLHRKNISDIIIIPLFVASASTHIFELSGILSKYMKDYRYSITPCMDDHQYVVNHIIKQAKKLSVNPNKEALIIIGHGSDQPPFEEQWGRMLASLQLKLKQATEYQEISYATYFPNTIKTELAAISEELTTIVVPLFLSKGIYTDKKIPEELGGYQVKYSSEAYLSDDWITAWLQNQINNFVEVSNTPGVEV